MSTRAVYTFEDQHDIVAVYKHHDGYPTGAAKFLQAAKAYAWELPRYEADDFGAAFVRANKVAGGGIRLMSGTALDQFPSDIEFWYEVFGVLEKDIMLRANRVSDNKATKIFEGTLAEFTQWADAWDKVA